MQTGFADFDSPLHWRQDRELRGYNTLNIGANYESMMRWLGRGNRDEVMFPEGEDRNSWHKEPNYLEIHRRMKQNVAGAIWGGHPTVEQSQLMLDNPPFEEWCPTCAVRSNHTGGRGAGPSPRIPKRPPSFRRCNPFPLGGHRHDPAAPAYPYVDHPAEVGGGGRQGPHPVHLVAPAAGRRPHAFTSSR